MSLNTILLLPNGTLFKIKIMYHLVFGLFYSMCPVDRCTIWIFNVPFSKSPKNLQETSSNPTTYDADTKRAKVRATKIRFFDSQLSQDVQISNPSIRFKTEVFLPMIDSLISNLNQRKASYSILDSLYSFFAKLHILSEVDIVMHCN